MPYAPHPAARPRILRGLLAAVHPKTCPSSVPVGQRAKPAPITAVVKGCGQLSGDGRDRQLYVGCGGCGGRGACGGCGACGADLCVARGSLSCHAHYCTLLWEPCPCGHDPLPCTCVQGPKKIYPSFQLLRRQLEQVAAASQRRPPKSMNCMRTSTMVTCRCTQRACERPGPRDGL